MKTQLVLLFSFLGYLSSVVDGSSLIDDYVHQIENQAEDRLLQKETERGKIYSRCNLWNQCDEGLECVITLGRRVCYPMSCLQQAVENTFYEQNMGTFTDTILERAGVQISGIFNRSTAERVEGEDAISDQEKSKFIINAGVTERLVKALQEDTTVVDAFRNNARPCFQTDPARRLADAKQSDSEVYYVGFELETAIITKLHFQLGTMAYPNGTIPEKNWYSDICFGAGIDFDIHIAPVMGVLSSTNPADIRQPAIMLDSDLSFGFHIGGAAIGWTIPDCVMRAEFTTPCTEDGTLLGFGIGGGLGVYACGPIECNLQNRQE